MPPRALYPHPEFPADIVRVDIPQPLLGTMADGDRIDIVFCGLWFPDPETGVMDYEPPRWRAELDADGNVIDMPEEERAALKALRLARTA